MVICTTGIGISIAANKIKGIRCAHCADCLEAEMTRRHNDANMMAIGAGFTGKNLAERMVEVFLSTDFEGGRHERRVNKLNAIQPWSGQAQSRWRRGDETWRGTKGYRSYRGRALQGARSRWQSCWC
ncbi:MAG: RpiB/LacA/LacB family sugar-phosphate isomerase [Dysosmobacter sp.]